MEQQCQAWGRKEQSHWAARPLGGDTAHMSQARQALGSEPLEKVDGTSEGMSLFLPLFTSRGPKQMLDREDGVAGVEQTQTSASKPGGS